MNGSIRFNDDINIEVAVDPTAAEGSRLTGAKNLVDGQELGTGGGGIENVEVEIINNLSSDPIWIPDYIEMYPTVADDKLTIGISPEENIAAGSSHTLNIAKSSIPTLILGAAFNEMSGSDNIEITYDEEREMYEIVISGSGSITISDGG